MQRSNLKLAGWRRPRDGERISSRFVLQSRTQLTRCWGTVPSSFPSLPRVASSGTEAWRTPFRGLPHTGQLALPAALGTRWSPCRRPSRDAQTEDLRSPTSTGLGRGVAAPFARRRPNRECALTRGEPADSKILIPQRPRTHGRAPLPTTPALLHPSGFTTARHRRSCARHSPTCQPTRLDRHQLRPPSVPISHAHPN